MNILFLAPHPYYIDRGTPIAVDCMLRVLSQRGENVDVITYHEGIDKNHKNIHLHRIFSLPFVKGIRPGLSWKKIVCDAVMLIKVMLMLGKKRYHVIHAVEESVFMALLAKILFRVPYIYDMDSSLSLQITDKLPYLTPLIALLEFAEKIAIKHSTATVPVCEALDKIVKRCDVAKKSFLLQDISLLDEMKIDEKEDIRRNLGISGVVLMYIGNLEFYQGIDLLLESFSQAFHQVKDMHLVIIGGNDADIRKYQEIAQTQGIAEHVFFLGPKPVTAMATYLYQADILVSPRTRGNNTPMKIFPYLHSGKAVLASQIESHTQVINDQVALLAPPDVPSFAEAICTLVENEEIRMQLGKAGKAFIEKNNSFQSFEKKVNSIYDWISQKYT